MSLQSLLENYFINNQFLLLSLVLLLATPNAYAKCIEGDCDNGDVYEGDFLKVERTGKGTITWPVALLRTVTGLMESLLKHLQSKKEGKGSLTPVY